MHCGSEAAPFRCTARLGISSRPRHVWSASAATLNHSDQVSDCGQHASRARLTTWLATVHAWSCFSKRLIASREPTLLNLTHDCNVAPVYFCSFSDVQNPVARCAGSLWTCVLVPLSRFSHSLCAWLHCTLRRASTHSLGGCLARSACSHPDDVRGPP